MVEKSKPAREKTIFLGPLRGKLKEDKKRRLVALYHGEWVVVKNHPVLRQMTVEEFVSM